MVNKLKTMLLPYRNQSIDLQCSELDWFLYDGSIGLYPFMTSVLHNMETSQLISTANQLTGYYTMGNTGR